MKNDNSNRSAFSIILPTTLFFFLFIFSQCQHENFGKQSSPTIDQSSSKNISTANEKQKGAHVFHMGCTQNFEALTQYNLEWITLVPWGYQEDYDSPTMRHHRGDSSRMMRRDSNLVDRIELVHDVGFKVFLKPHIWIDTPSKGKWRSDIFPTTDEHWELWKTNYRDFILRYAKIAEQAGAEMFCIGTEFSRLSVEKPDFWRSLIREIRGIYSGKITYAANWYREYEKITFWEDLDYIGIQAYFPLVKHEYPTTRQISKAWGKYLPTIKSIHKKYNRKILFTEMGYKSTADSAIKPWEWVENPRDPTKNLSTETQANCYEAFFNTVWEKEWFAGIHIWQLRGNYTAGDEKNDIDFTIQGKPAEQVIARGFE